MGSNVLMLRWNRTVPGREAHAARTFQEFSEFLAARQKAGALDSFEAVLLEPHGGDTGLFLIRGTGGKLHELTGSPEWMRFQARTMHLLEAPALLRGVTGDAVQERMRIWMAELPREARPA